MAKIIVRDAEINMSDDYISLTDIAKQFPDQRPDRIIAAWLKNGNTLLFLEEWEIQHNDNFKPTRMSGFKAKSLENTTSISPSKFINETNAISLRSRQGRGGGTFAHPEVAIFFCYWLSPAFAVWMVKSFKKMLEAESERRSLEFHISKITDHIDEARNWLDTIPYQDADRNRLDTSNSSKPKKE